MKLSSLRTRFVLAYVGLIIAGFGCLALIAGRQLSVAAQEDFERQMVNETELAARGIERPLQEYYRGAIDAEELDEVLAIFETQIRAELTIFLTDQPSTHEPPDHDRPPPPGHEANLPSGFNYYPELQAAVQGKFALVERENSSGTPTIYIAAPIRSRTETVGYIQLARPASDLYEQINERWIFLGIGVGVISLLSLLASIYLSHSLIRPLKTLEETAMMLSQGHLSHRAPVMAADEVNELARAFNTMADQLEAMIETQRTFASNASHELRTPLTTMRLRTEALRYEKLDDQTRALYIQQLDEEARRMSDLIDDLLFLSRLDAGRTEIGTDQIDFARLVDSLYFTFAEDASANQIDLKVMLPPGENLVIHASINHVTILFRNLLDNALKYTPEGGSVVWEVNTDADDIVSVIRDSGQGIEPENLPHIFDRFYRGDRAHTRDIPGTGLGLHIVKAIADIYGARISVQSAGKDQGTTITVRWKRANKFKDI